MKKLVFIALGILLSFQLSAQLKNTQFYYFQDKKFYIELDSSRLLIISEGSFSSDDIAKKGIEDFNVEHSSKSFVKQNVILSDEMRSKNDEEVFFTEIRFLKEVPQKEYSNVIQKLKEESNVVQVCPTYLVGGKKLSLTNNFYVQLRDAEDKQKLFDMAKQYSIQVLGYNEFMPLWFTLSCTRLTPFNAIEAANLFYESQFFKNSEPEFLYQDLLTSNDQYFYNQWGLKNTGQHCSTSSIDIRAENAWSIATGSNVQIAVFDHGIKMDHPDLVNNILGTGYDAQTNTTPSILRGPHGTLCAGVAGAEQNNTIGVSGVAPNADLISVSISLTWGDTPQQLANGFNWAWNNGADVISNSWGGYSPSSIIENAIADALTYGRGGLGTIIVFAAGNENNTSIRYPGNSNPDILVVGAIAPNGQRKSYTSCDGETGWGSCYGTQLDIMAPGVLIPSTTSTDGYSQTFNGTSSACPHVAGVAALILSVDPNLTALQVRNIIETTAQKVGGYSYQSTGGRPNGTWHNEMGYGLVNAYASVLAACTTTNFVSQTVTTNTTINGCTINVQNVSVQNNAKLTLNALNEIIINDTFEVLTGSQLELL